VVASNLSVLRARKGQRVLLVDLDTGLANAHLLLGLAPAYDLGHVIDGSVSAAAARVEGPEGLHLLCGGVGRAALANLGRRELDRLFKALRQIEYDYDLIIVDHGAGMGLSTQAHLAAADALLLVTQPETTALSDAYAVYKRSRLLHPRLPVGVVVNRARSEARAYAAWERLRGVALRFLEAEPRYLGWVPADMAVSDSVEQRIPVSLASPHAESARAITRISCWDILDSRRDLEKPSGRGSFYERARRALR